MLSYTENLKTRLLEAYQSQPENYKPRTKYLCENEQPCFINRLILEPSPYLLQHAHNPVDWYAWSEEALHRARVENKPIFLSIGYAACHWCHVMEQESFDNLEISKFLNKHFIAIKVDRERRPDIDELFGNAVMIFQGQQGWPMSLFLTPDGKPFFGAGYFDADEFKNLLLKISDSWENQQDEVIKKAQKIINELQSRDIGQKKTVEINDKLRVRAIKDLLSIADNYQGGFGESEKFPREPWLFLLLDDSLGNTSKNDSLKVLQLTLLKMASGGIYDQLTGGFHRYATDPYWKVPHFEKMLYNQALLIPLYLQVNRIDENPFYLRVAKQTADFLLQVFQDEQGGFYSSIDADSEGEEGRYYTWHIKDWKKNLSQKDQDFITELYDVDEYGETDKDRNVLYLTESLEEYAAYKNQSIKKILKRLDEIRNHLNSVRSKRVQPDIDKKIIMGWNGLAITALADAALYFHDDDYLHAAIKASNYIWENMRMEKIFYRVNYQGDLSQTAQLDDYAYYLQALIKLYDVKHNKVDLQRALILAEYMLDHFWDEKQGGFFNALQDELAPLPLRTKSAFDKTLISANAVAAQMLIRLYNRTGEEKYRQKARETLSSFATEIGQVPSAYSGLLVAAHELRSGEKGLPLYAARGHIRVDAEISESESNHYQLAINLNVDDGWHINSSTPLDKALIPTTISVTNNTAWTIKNLNYPAQQIKKLGYSESVLALYQGNLTIKSRLLKVGKVLNPVINLRLQACNDRLCLPPENMQLMPRILSEY